MSSQSYHGYYATGSQPIAMPHKQQSGYYPYPQAPYSQSPPEASDSGISGGASYEPTATASSYAASASDYESTTNSSVDLLEFMHDRLQNAYNPMPMDRNLAQQAQVSGKLNAKQRQLLELQALAQQRFAAMQAQFADGLKTAKEVERDLAWTQKKVNQLNKRAAHKYPKEYAMAQERYPGQIEA
jgi:hypothetical protein